MCRPIAPVCRSRCSSASSDCTSGRGCPIATGAAPCWQSNIALFSTDGRRFAVDRGSVHDRAARLHVRDRRLGQIEHAVDVGAEGEVPLLVADLLEADMGHLIGGVDR